MILCIVVLHRVHKGGHRLSCSTCLFCFPPGNFTQYDFSKNYFSWLRLRVWLWLQLGLGLRLV